MNTEKLKGIWEKIKAMVKKVSKKVWIIAAAALVVIAAVIVIFLNSRPYTVLFSDLGASDVSEILTCFNEWGVTDYRMRNGDTILVRSNMENSLRARLLEEGYPSQGFAWTSSYSSNISALSTEAERNQVALEELERKMAATISCFQNVRDAVVDINPGTDNSYILDSNNIEAASASVTVMMANGKTLTAQQAGAIRNMLAYGVKGMQMNTSAVTILDTLGNTYNAASSDSYNADASTLKLVLEEQYSNKVRTQIMQWLNALYGEGNAQATVNCVVELGYSTIDSHEVILPEWAQDGSTKGAGTIGSIIWNGSFALNEDGTVGGVVGTSTNSDFSEYVEGLFDPDSGLNSFSFSGQTDMDNTTVDTHTIRSAAYVSDLTVAVTINSSTAGLVNIESIRSHVATSAGITPVVTETMTADEYLSSKISVLAEPFYVDPATDTTPSGGSNFPLPMWMVYAAAGGLVLFLILLIVILLIARKRKKKKQIQQQIEEEKTAALLATMGIPQEELVGADVMELHTERSMELRQDIRKFAEENPEIAAQLLKTWVRGDDEDG